jgi:TRAP-type transport system periplasmic protein
MRMFARTLLILVTSLLALAGPASAQVTIKLGTLAPSGSPWHNLLKQMAQEWSTASGGKVTLKVFPGGTVGNEGDMVRKMRVGQLQAASITTIGLHDIAADPQAISSPLVIGSYDELDCVMKQVQTKLEKALDEKGFVALQWADVGFVHFFTSKPFTKPEELKNRKIFAWEGDPASVEAWRKVGIQPVILSSTDVIPSLQTGMIDTIAAAPLYAFTARIFTKANHMIDLRWAILNGATVVRKDEWEKIDPATRPKLIAIAQSYSKRIDTEVRRVSSDAITQMKAQGLQVVTPVDMAGWQKTADEANAVVRGKVVPAAIFDEVQTTVKKCRSDKKP